MAEIRSIISGACREVIRQRALGFQYVAFEEISALAVSPVVNSGRVSGYGQFKQRLGRGGYVILFDNRFSAFSSKSVSPDLKLTYYR